MLIINKRNNRNHKLKYKVIKTDKELDEPTENRTGIGQHDLIGRSSVFV